MAGIKEAKTKIGQEVEIKGWIYRKRSSGSILFILVRDSDGVIQTVVRKDLVDEQSWKEAEDAKIEASVDIIGIVKEDKRSPVGVEIEVSKFRSIANAEPFPITEYQSTELLLDKRYLWLRSIKMTNIMKIRALVFRYAREYLDSQGFYEITPPIITKAGGETGSSLFEVNYFGEKAYLTESSQLYAEAMIYSLEKVYSFAPSFRAEKSRTVKHLAEYWHLEPEAAFYDLEKLMKLEEGLVSYIANKLADSAEDTLKQLGVDPNYLRSIKPPFKRITYEEALKIVNEKGNRNLKWGDDLGADEEKILTADEKLPIFVMYWPREMKPFYMPINEKDPRTVKCVDLQAPMGHGEIAGGSERIWKLDELLERFKEVEKATGVKFNLDHYAWYIDLRRYGSVPHAGFGMGMERVIKWLLNLDHIRDAIPFPRMINRVFP
jgi:asparaginyl-tRNA synthetase